MSDAARVEDAWSGEAPIVDPEAPTVPRRLIMGSLAFLLAMILLGGFYVVTQRAVERAHVHWSQAVGVSKSADACDSAIRSAPTAGCQTAGLQIRRVSTGR